MGRRSPLAWRDKLSPGLLLALSAFRTAGLAVLHGKPEEEALEELRQAVAKIKERYPCEKPSAWEAIYVSATPDPSEHAIQRIHWTRHRTPLWQDCVKMGAGDSRAFGRVQKTAESYYNMRWNPKWAQPIKSDRLHLAVFEMGLGLGLEKLTAEELADCFQEVCPCGKEHDADALKKQRARFLKAIRKAIAAEKELRDSTVQGASGTKHD